MCVYMYIFCILYFVLRLLFPNAYHLVVFVFLVLIFDFCFCFGVLGRDFYIDFIYQRVDWREGFGVNLCYILNF